MIVAVDGPAASGKGTIARAIARHFALPHLDTGLLYRAAALALLRRGGDPASQDEAVAACTMAGIDFSDPELKSEAAGGIASRISVYPGVRAALIDRQRSFARQSGGGVLDGRDIGTVIAPDADAKLFVTADPEVRARRRFEELERLGMPLPFGDVLADIEARDARDRSRATAPLARAEDAYLLDTSKLAVDAAVEEAIAAVRRLASRA